MGGWQEVPQLWLLPWLSPSSQGCVFALELPLPSVPAGKTFWGETQGDIVPYPHTGCSRGRGFRLVLTGQEPQLVGSFLIMEPSIALAFL